MELTAFSKLLIVAFVGSILASAISFSFQPFIWTFVIIVILVLVLGTLDAFGVKFDDPALMVRRWKLKQARRKELERKIEALTDKISVELDPDEIGKMVDQRLDLEDKLYNL